MKNKDKLNLIKPVGKTWETKKEFLSYPTTCRPSDRHKYTKLQTFKIFILLVSPR